MNSGERPDYWLRAKRSLLRRDVVLPLGLLAAACVWLMAWAGRVPLRRRRQRLLDGERPGARVEQLAQRREIHVRGHVERAGGAHPRPALRRRSAERDVEFLRRNTDRPAKITLPGPFTMAQQARNEFYESMEEMAMDFAAAVNAEARELQAAGADVIQLDEPWLRNDPEGAKRYAVPAINRALEGLTVPTALHLCFGYAAVVRHQKPTGYSFLPQLAATTAAQISIEAAQPKIDLGVLDDLAGKSIILGVIDLGDPAVETVDQVAARIRAGLTRVKPERLILAPDCGMKYLPRETAFGKLQALSAAARAVRAIL